MAQFRVGCVPYVNARPLVAAFDQPNEFVDVVYDVPSRLPALLDSGEVDAILVSSIELLRRDDLLPVAEVGIMSYGPVRSVRMLSKVPLAEIKTLALDKSSLTSNILAQIILAEQGVFPATETADPDPTEMLKNHDACVVIGDIGFEAYGTGLVDIDLGQAWTDMTGMPFVWAMWLGKITRPMDSQKLWTMLYLAFQASGFSSLHSQLNRSKNETGDLEDPWKEELYKIPGEREKMERYCADQSQRRDYVINSTLPRCNWEAAQIESYLLHNVRYTSTDSRDALETFRNLIEKHSLCHLHKPPPDSFDLAKQILALIPTDQS